MTKCNLLKMGKSMGGGNRFQDAAFHKQDFCPFLYITVCYTESETLNKFMQFT